MIKNALEFFKNLPPKMCTSCGVIIEEQHECYGNKCEKCLDIPTTKMNKTPAITN